jgi:hypothetical protein
MLNPILRAVRRPLVLSLTLLAAGCSGEPAGVPAVAPTDGQGTTVAASSPTPAPAPPA